MSESAVEAEPVVVAADDVAVVVRGRVEAGPRIAGSIEPRRRAAVRAETGGSLVEVSVELGEAVRRGAVLARIEDGAQAAAVRAAEVGLAAARRDRVLAERDQARSRRMARAGALTGREADGAAMAAGAARSRVGAAQAALAEARRALAATVVSAPIDGLVADVAGHEGDVVGPGSPLFAIIDPSSMWLRSSLPAAAVRGLAAGARVSFAVSGIAGQRFTGVVERIAPIASLATRQIPILVAIPDQGGQVLAGLFAEGRVIVESREGLTIPLAALDGDAGPVAVVRGGRVVRVAVELGIRDPVADVVEVVSGLDAGESVLVRSSRMLVPGTRVAIERRETPELAARAAGSER